MDAALSPLQRLELMGFKNVGDWRLDGEIPKCNLAECADSQNILYAFVLDEEVVYIGKTVQPLNRGLYGYRLPGLTQSTNLKGNGLIREALLSKRTLKVYALPDNGLLYYGGFHVNLAAGLEDSLVSALKPSWNGLGKN